MHIRLHQRIFMSTMQWFFQALQNTVLLEKIQALKLIICDVDGTLTDAQVYFSLDGEDGRSFSVQDGFAMEKAVKAGLQLCLMSGKGNKTTVLRGTQLGIPEQLCIVGVKHKPTIIHTLIEQYNLAPHEIALCGDDFLDAQVKLELSQVFFAVPANTPFYLKPYADLQLPLVGGQGAIRLFLDLVLFVQGRHFAQELIENSLKNYDENKI